MHLDGPGFFLPPLAVFKRRMWVFFVQEGLTTAHGELEMPAKSPSVGGGYLKKPKNYISWSFCQEKVFW